MVCAILLGPVAAVIITLWHQERKQKRDQKLALLRHLLAYRHLPADANYSHAINMIPLEFSDEPNVIAAHKEFIAAAYAQGDDNDEKPIAEKRAIKQTRLIYEIAHSLGFGIRETDLQTEGYTATGFVERDHAFIDGHKAWRDIANLLFIQARQAEGRPLNEKELNYLGLQGAREEVSDDTG
jgi:hypothetical protein